MNSRCALFEIVRATLGIAVAVFIAIVFIFLGNIYRKPAPLEPAFQNKMLSEWVSLYSQSHSDRAWASSAVRAIGTNALPFLLSELKQTETPALGRAKRKVQERVTILLTTGADRARLALAGFEILGTNAIPVIPDLIELFRDTDPYLGGQDPAYQAARALKLIGPTAAIPALISATTNANEMIRVHACFALGELGDSNAVPALTLSLTDRSRMVRIRSAIALGKLRAAHETAVPALAKALTDPDSAVRFSAADALRLYGSTASSALPDLQKALDKELARPPGQPGRGAVFDEKTGSEVATTISNALTQIRAPSTSGL
jgi:hypothetical protein